MPSISSFDVISVVVTEPKIFLCIPASATEAGAVNPNGIKTHLANGWITMDQEVYQEISLIVIFSITEFLID